MGSLNQANIGCPPDTSALADKIHNTDLKSVFGVQ